LRLYDVSRQQLLAAAAAHKLSVQQQQAQQQQQQQRPRRSLVPGGSQGRDQQQQQQGPERGHVMRDHPSATAAAAGEQDGGPGSTAGRAVPNQLEGTASPAVQQQPGVRGEAGDSSMQVVMARLSTEADDVMSAVSNSVGEAAEADGVCPWAAAYAGVDQFMGTLAMVFGGVQDGAS
jgi:hypothetical protein